MGRPNETGIVLITPPFEEKYDWTCIVEGSECCECMWYRQIPLTTSVIAWKRAKSHHGCLQTFLSHSRVIFNSEKREIYRKWKMRIALKCLSRRSLFRWCSEFLNEKSSHALDKVMTCRQYWFKTAITHASGGIWRCFMHTQHSRRACAVKYLFKWRSYYINAILVWATVIVKYRIDIKYYNLYW